MSETPDTAMQALSPGQMLKRAREGKNLTVAAIATLMNLDLRTIEALESGDQSKLPAPIFVRGYLRGYARLVGVNESAVLEAYLAHAPQDPMPRSVGMSKVPVRPAFRAPALPWRGLLLVVVALVAVWLGIQWGPQLIARLTGDVAPEPAVVGETALPLSATSPPEPVEHASPADASVAVPLNVPQGEDAAAAAPNMPGAETPGGETGQVGLTLPAPTPVPLSEPVPAAEPEPVLPAESDFGPQTGDAATPAPVPQQSPAPAPGEVRIDLRITADSWVEVQAADGNKLVLDLLHKGDTRSVTGKPPISVLLGNAAGVAIDVDGKPFDHRRYDRDNIARFQIGEKP